MNCTNCGKESEAPVCQDCVQQQYQQEQHQQEQYHQKQVVTQPKAEVSSFDNPISLKHWLLNSLVLCIPFAGWVFLIIWALGTGNTSESKKNYARANLIVSAGMVILITIFYVIFFAIIFSSLASTPY